MLKIERTVLPSPDQWDIIIEGMRNPMNSWDKSDSYTTHICDPETLECADFQFFLGDADHNLMTSLAKGGAVHAKYRRMIPVYLTINAPLYWWKEFDTYKVGTVCNSCSTMHKIHSKEFTLDDFSHEYMRDSSLCCLEDTMTRMNFWRQKFIEQTHPETHKDGCMSAKDCWWQMIQLLPTSYNQKRTVMLNYEVLVNIYHSRKNHKLDEWHTFCDWIRDLPHSELITGGK
jgi:hypothetical protein